jgi:hypothetical protein
VDTNNPKEAERAIIKLVEQEPANYPKFLQLTEVYLKEGDLNSAARILSMSSEHLLVGGQSDEFLHWTNEILARNPEHLDALRLAVRYHGWHRDEAELKKSLESLAEIARLNSALDDERYALTQLVMIAPHETTYARRLAELKAEHDFGETEPEPLPVHPIAEPSKFGELVDAGAEIFKGDFGELNGDFKLVDADKFIDRNAAQNGSNGAAPPEEDAGEYIVEGVIDETYSKTAETRKEDLELKAAAQVRLEQEIEGVEFYIAQGYTELAEKSLAALEEEFGNREKIAEIRRQLGGCSAAAVEIDVQALPKEAAAEQVSLEAVETEKRSWSERDPAERFRHS